jgi:hypothetical protein
MTAMTSIGMLFVLPQQALDARIKLTDVQYLRDLACIREMFNIKQQ